LLSYGGYHQLQLCHGALQHFNGVLWWCCALESLCNFSFFEVRLYTFRKPQIPHSSFKYEIRLKALSFKMTSNIKDEESMKQRNHRVGE
jgi:hypothetical protein